MRANDERVRGLITQEAADWFVANRAGLAAGERQAFAGWLRASPVHVEEYLAVSVIARDLHAACEEPAEFVDALLEQARGARDAGLKAAPLWPGLIVGARRGQSLPWRAAAAALGALAVVGLGLLWNERRTAHVPRTVETVAMHYFTRHGEQKAERLADNSMVHLNTDTAVTVRFGAQQRLVELDAGEVYFEVTHDPARAFRVRAASAEVVDIGTRFDVRVEHDSIVVTVVEGRVDVRPSLVADRPSVRLGANQQVTISGGTWPAAPVAVDARRTTAWLHRQISFDHQPLERVAQEFNRYSRKPIEITTPALRYLQISGVFSTDDTDAFVAFLRSLDGVHVEETATRIRVSQNQR